MIKPPKISVTSKTIWYALLMILVSKYFPGASQFISENPEIAVILNSAVMIALRRLTNNSMRFL